MSIKNNLLVSFRHLKADKTNTLINLTGLIFGLGIVAVDSGICAERTGLQSFFCQP